MVLSMDRWVGKVAIVTGASSGIGAAIAEHLVKEGLKVVGLARRKERIEELSRKLGDKKGKLYAVNADVTKEDDIKSAFDWVLKNVGPVHILINNAGLMQQTSLIDGETEKWKRVLDVNILGLCIATREAVRVMRSNNIDGHIVHLNSIAGHVPVTFPEMNVYPASKYAVTALTETLRQELLQYNTKIKITSVSPGAVKTEFIDSCTFDEKAAEYINNLSFLQAEDIADAIIYALSTPVHVQVHEITVQPLGAIVGSID